MEFVQDKADRKSLNLTESKPKVIFKPLPEDDPKQRQPDITLAKENMA